MWKETYAIAKGRVLEIESVVRQYPSSFGNATPVPVADSFTQYEGFVGVLVHWVWLSEGSLCSYDQVDPGAIFSLQDQVRCIDLGWVFIEQRALVFQLLDESIDATETPRVRMVQLVDVHQICFVGSQSGSMRRIGCRLVVVEHDHISSVAASVVHGR
jgi:hypothetical protein